MQQSEIGLADTFSLSSVEILDRQTDIGADYKVDRVYVTAIFEGNTCTVYKSFVLNYGTYEDTWNLDSIKNYNAGESGYMVKTLPDESLIDAYLVSIMPDLRVCPQSNILIGRLHIPEIIIYLPPLNAGQKPHWKMLFMVPLEVLRLT